MAKRIIALFPGQGAQSTGMGKDLYQNFPIAQTAFEEASDAISLDLKKLCFEGPDADLMLTENTQPCMLVTSVAAFRVAETELGFVPALVAGHSLGEYSALVAAKAIKLAAAVRWVRERGRAMQKAVPAGQGTMAAVMNLSDEKTVSLCMKATENAAVKRQGNKEQSWDVEAVVEPANYNAPSQIVISGSKDAVQEALDLIKTDPEFAGAKAVPLSVSAPFHCKLMLPVRNRMSELFLNGPTDDKPQSLSFPYLPNRTARITQEPGVILELLIDQVTHPVLWKQSMQAAIEQGIEQGIEFGPGSVLQGLAKRISKEAGKPLVIQTMGDTQALKTLQL